MRSSPVPIEITDDLVKQVIEEVKKRFIPGTKMKADFVKLLAGAGYPTHFFSKLLRHDPEHPDFHKTESPQFHDNGFPTWDANVLKAPFCAGAGPQEPKSTCQFIENTVFNKNIPVGQILALGDCLDGGVDDEESRYKPSFYDYCLSPRDNQKFGEYTLTVEIISGTPLLAEEKGGQAFPKGIVQSCLTVTREGNPEENREKETRIIKVTLIGLVDHQSLYLAGGEQEKREMESEIGFSQSCEERKKIFWELLSQSILLEQAHKFMFVHCTAGLGRTGHMIAMFELVKNYASIFSTPDPKKIAIRILKMIDKLRESRPALVLTVDQMVNTIKNSVILYPYGLQKGYINVIQPSLTNTTCSIQKMLVPPEAKRIKNSPKKSPKKLKKRVGNNSEKPKDVMPPDVTPGFYGSGNSNVIFPGLPVVNSTDQPLPETPAPDNDRRPHQIHFSVM